MESSTQSSRSWKLLPTSISETTHSERCLSKKSLHVRQFSRLFCSLQKVNGTFKACFIPLNVHSRSDYSHRSSFSTETVKWVEAVTKTKRMFFLHRLRSITVSLYKWPVMDLTVGNRSGKPCWLLEKVCFYHNMKYVFKDTNKTWQCGQDWIMITSSFYDVTAHMATHFDKFPFF